MPDSFAQRMAQVPPRLLLPHGSAAPDGSPSSTPSALPDAVPSCWLVLATDDEDGSHVLPLVDDGQQPRRARAGDGWATALVALGLHPDGERGWAVRVVEPLDAATLRGSLIEQPMSGSSWAEAIEVAGAYRVRLMLRPESLSAPSSQPWRHIGHTAPDLVVGGRFDVAWNSADRTQSLASVVLVADVASETSVAEVLNREATRHLRGADTADSTLALATTLGETLARAHHALATPSPELPEPLTVMDAEGAALLDRRVKDVLSEAVVLTEADVRETLRAHMVDLRSSFAELSFATGAWVLPAVPLGSLEQFLVRGRPTRSRPTDRSRCGGTAPGGDGSGSAASRGDARRARRTEADGRRRRARAGRKGSDVGWCGARDGARALRGDTHRLRTGAAARRPPAAGLRDRGRVPGAHLRVARAAHLELGTGRRIGRAAQPLVRPLP